ncbi:penicillin-binding protein 2 [Patescibacteria group bacterium]|nr:penicillin-binding protein 2 [Patescibacteria group bacterium]
MQGEGEIEGRSKLILIVIIGTFLFIVVRVAWLQLVEGKRYRRLSETSHLRLLPLPAPRGKILDREGKVLADNQAVFSIGAIPENIENLPELFNSLEQILPLDADLIKKRIKNAPNPFRPVVLKKNISLSKVTYLLEREEKFPGVVVLTQPVRNYPYGQLMAHLLGYLGEINKEELSRGLASGIEAGDLVGKIGIEKVYNRYLQGEKGGKQLEVDAHGRELRTISSKDSLPGENIYLTLNLKMQQIAEEELGERKGVVLIGNPHTGEILVFLSHPSFNPNLFAQGISLSVRDKLFSDPDNSLENRAIRGEYHPGSSFKIIVAAAALEEGKATKSTTFFCGGELRVAKRVFKCWKEEGHGWLDLEEAIIHSCNAYFYQLGSKVGTESIIKYAKLFGLGQPVGIDLVSEKKGLLPTPEWKKKNYKEIWYPGDTANLSIGQGYILVTPLQMLGLINVIANGGNLLKSYLLKRIVDFEGKVIFSNPSQKMRRIPISSSTLEILRRSLRGVVTQGTGWRAENKVVKISGKTGTAEIAGREEPDNWFIGYAPFENPSLSIVVLVEQRKEERAIAPEIAGKIFARIFTSIQVKKK